MDHQILPEKAQMGLKSDWKVIWGKEEIFVEGLGPNGLDELKALLCNRYHLQEDDYYLLSNGRKLTAEPINGHIQVIPRLLGGKGGFGSMLRAIGAQIEKTTNREACRDLSGRRLRDINEEQRLKKWVSQQAEREKEAKEKKKKKLEKLLEKPKHEFKDEEYDKERESLPEQVEDAVLKGLEAGCSTTKRKPDESDKSKIPKKKPKLWIDSELDEDLSLSEGESDEEGKDTETSLAKSDNC
ncbi:replication stress response regulator SDE2 [Anthonomus grandis grandis]|uniref:replication stress response regulator SDE2 n=1 Tax=Anthonomus grandis grandis TaxID=2921223 RepID=UPI002166A7FB|nr:replication stress response regulator SDE2 [Anthonomus grandis grandis]